MKLNEEDSVEWVNMQKKTIWRKRNEGNDKMDQHAAE